MDSFDTAKAKPLQQLRFYLLVALIWWSAVMGIIFSYNLAKTKEFTVALAKDYANATIDKDIAYRHWVTQHGGVYVPVSDFTPPNPYLKVPNRDTNISGREFTLMNSAYITRQLAQLSKVDDPVKIHVTSLNPIRPGNAPDPWETKALKSFEKGNKELSELVEDGTKLRAMRAFITEKGCLKCHEGQGCKIGDVRGGIAVSVGMAPYLEKERGSIHSLLLTHLAIWFVGSIATIVGYLLLKNNLVELVKTKNQLDKLNKHLQEKVKTETGKLVEKEKLLIQQSKMAMMGEMIGAIGHQWRQPLNSLAIMVQDIAAAKKFGELTDESIDEFKDDSMRIIETMSKTIDDFKGFYKTNKKEEHFCAESAIDEVVAILSAQLKHASITVDFERSVKHEIFGLKNELKQVILNLFSNAKDAILENKRDDGIIKVACVKENGNLLISIEDNGGGIKEEHLGQIFEPYFTTKPEGSGTGIGLYMSKEIIEKHMHGKLKVANMVNGARFTIVLDTTQPTKKG